MILSTEHSKIDQSTEMKNRLVVAHGVVKNGSAWIGVPINSY